MTECTTKSLDFASLGRKKIQADFTGGQLTSDAGSLLLREVDKRLDLIDAINSCIPDPRDQRYVQHSQRTMLAQRIMAIALGYEDLNDHQTLRNDWLFQTVTERGIDPEQALGTIPAKWHYERTEQKQRLFGSFSYAASTWDRQRRVIAKAEHSSHGENPRFVVTNLPGEEQFLYDQVYCRRGDMENRIKEQQLYLFANRASSHDFLANQFRLILSSAAYVLMETLRREGLKNTKMEKAQAHTIRNKLLKVAAVIQVSTRRIVFHLASGYPYKELFVKLLSHLTRQPIPVFGFT